jgi:hypothetical protein
MTGLAEQFKRMERVVVGVTKPLLQFAQDGEVCVRSGLRRVAPAYRGRAMGVASSGLLAAQGIGFLAAGAAVDAGPAPATVAGLSGSAGAVVVFAIARYWRRASRPPAERESPPGARPYSQTSRT